MAVGHRATPAPRITPSPGPMRPEWSTSAWSQATASSRRDRRQRLGSDRGRGRTLPRGPKPTHTPSPTPRRRASSTSIPLWVHVPRLLAVSPTGQVVGHADHRPAAPHSRPSPGPLPEGWSPSAGSARKHQHALCRELELVRWSVYASPSRRARVPRVLVVGRLAPCRHRPPRRRRRQHIQPMRSPSTTTVRSPGASASAMAPSVPSCGPASTRVSPPPPTIEIPTPGPNAVVDFGAPLVATFSCADEIGGSGLVTCTAEQGASQATAPSPLTLNTTNTGNADVYRHRTRPRGQRTGPRAHLHGVARPGVRGRDPIPRLPILGSRRRLRRGLHRRHDLDGGRQFVADVTRLG